MIGEVLARRAGREQVGVVTGSEYVERAQPSDVVALPEGSWGTGGTHFTWDNADTRWMWPEIHERESRMEDLASRFPNATGAHRAVLNQAARELLLLESSDWPFLVTTGQAAEYAVQRFTQHCERFDRLATAAGIGHAEVVDERMAAELFERDKVFADIDYRQWAQR